MSKKRAVGYCRTSTETQRDNTSIPTQKEEISRFAEYNKYHLTHFFVDESKSGSKIEGREEFKQMLRDAANRKFDVLVVYDITRFSRDGFDIVDSVRILKREFGVDVVDTKGGFDTRTRDSGRTVANYVQVGMAEGERLRTLERTKTGKVETAKRNQPIGSKRPFGRIWDKKTKTWSIDEAKQKMAQDVAARYLAGESMKALAKEYGSDHSSLHRTITERCGDRWIQRVRCKELSIDETIETEVPRLLPDDVIEACKKRAVIQKTYHHQKVKSNTRRWPLSCRIFCEHCGLALTGCVAGKEKRYYRHSRKQCQRATVRMWVPAEELELAVFVDLFKTFGNPEAVRKAVEAALPDPVEINDLHDRKTRLEADLRKVNDAKERIINAVADGTLTNAEARKKKDDLDKRIKELEEVLATVSKQLETVPTPEQIQATGVRLASRFHTLDFCTTTAINSDFAAMTYEDKRALVEMVFGGKTVDGTKMGVWVSWVAGQEDKKRKKQWRYRIVGHLSFDRNGLTPVEYPVPDEDTDEPLTGGVKQRELLKFNEQRKRGVRADGCR
jgi:site-specific DNA recombinase